MAWYKPWEHQGNVAKDRRRGEIAEREAAEAATQDPYGPNAPQWDASGFPVGPMPKGKYALDYQYEANRRAEARRQVLWGDAQGSMQRGLDLFQSYRPGGAAAAASGMYGQKAGLSATQALNTAAPDLLIDWREQIRARAEENANDLNRNAQLITGLSAFNFLAGGTPTSMATPPPPPQAGENVSGAPGGTYAAGAAQGATIGGDVGSAPGAAQGAAQGAAVGAQAGTNAGQPGVLPGILTPEQRGLGGGGGGGGDMGGGLGPGGGARGAGGGRARPGGGGGATDESGAGMGGAAVAGGGLGDFSGPAVANRAMSTAPLSIDTAAELWAEDPQREQSTALMVASARETLLSAIALG